MTTFPMDGPHSPAQTIEAANQAAELIRYLNACTQVGQDGLMKPEDAYAFLAELYTVTQRLPQVCAQIAAFLGGQLETGTLADSGGKDPERQVTDARFWLDSAGRRAGEMTANLQQAQNATTGLYMKEDGGGDGR